MADAKRMTKIVETEKVVVERTEVDTITLELSQDEANIVRTLLGKCDRGGLTTPIFKALEPVTVRGAYKVVAKNSWDFLPTFNVIEGSGDW